MQSKTIRVVAGVVGAGVLAIAGFLAPSPQGITEIKKHEATRLAVYLDPINIPTVCIGSTGKDVYIGMPKQTEAQCEVRLRKDLAVAVQAVQVGVKRPISQAQFDALVSFVFNVGSSAFSKSTMLRLINSDQCEAATAQFHRWNRAGGRILKGLTNRRAAEAALFGKDCNLW